MRWSLMLIVLIVAVGCASGYYEENPEATLDIKQVMRSGVGGSAALFAGEDGYWIEADALTKERRVLLDALIAKRVYHRLPPDRYRELMDALNRKDRKKLEEFRDDFEPEEFARMVQFLELRPRGMPDPGYLEEKQSKQKPRVTRFMGHSVLEIQYPDGVLRIARYEPFRGVKARYDVALTAGAGFGHRGVVFKRFHVWATPELEGAWRALRRAADNAFFISIPMDGTGVRERDALGTMRTLMKEHYDGQWVHWTED